MGSWTSGSRARSHRDIVENCHRLDIADLSGHQSLVKAQRAFEAKIAKFVEFEIVAPSDGEQQHVRTLVGTSTRSGFGTGEAELPYLEWMSQTSMFIRLVATFPSYGGVRLWFECPRSGCRRRCRVLLRPLMTNARAYACRRCNGVDYATQRVSRVDRLSIRAERRLLRLDRTDDVTWIRPPGMHQRTFERIVREVEELDAVTRGRIAEIGAQLEKSFARIWQGHPRLDQQA